MYEQGLHAVHQARARDHLPLLPDPADGPDHRARPSTGLKKEWREASENMGASSIQYWRHVALPVLMPSLLGDDDPAVRERVRRAGHGVPADRRLDQLVTILIGAPAAAVTCCTTRASAMPWRWAWSRSWASRCSSTSGSSGEPSGGCDERPAPASARSDASRPSPSRRPRRRGAAARTGTRSCSWIVFVAGVDLFPAATDRHVRVLARAQPYLAPPTATRSTTRSSSRPRGTRSSSA